MPRECVIDIRDQCIAARVPFFFKQWGGVNKKANGRLLESQSWDEVPADKPYSKRRDIRDDRCAGVLS